MESLTLPALKTDADLKLKVENRKKNVFVTQLEEHREQKDEHIKHIPVITEGSSGLLETGVNTLQSTLVLKKHVEVDEMNTQLMDKRQQVHDCMKLLRERRAQLQQRQTETKQRAAEFEKFVEENELKRRRALKKFQTERQQIELKEKEKAELCSLLQDLQARRLYLKERVNKFKIFEDFLMKTLDLLPDSGGSREHPDSREKPRRAVLPEPLRPSGRHGRSHHDGHDKGVHGGESRPGEKSYESHRQQCCDSEEEQLWQNPDEEQEQRSHRDEEQEQRSHRDEEQEQRSHRDEEQEQRSHRDEDAAVDGHGCSRSHHQTVRVQYQRLVQI
ncbi:glutamic acid-rich protein isoform X5 [Pimephales promelas]|uniref:glutamic acid-rich protein isoform X5 n=1 Tax=Pimephales promelas TaxID=90988 RepID=UPI001955E5C3|nr:glutamic acid-rich protein isoform X5 [Pimephales promelas]